jgi:hypothetical protein
METHRMIFAGCFAGKVERVNSVKDNQRIIKIKDNKVQFPIENGNPDQYEAEI